jgi:hypothetical protein
VVSLRQFAAPLLVGELITAVTLEELWVAIRTPVTSVSTTREAVVHLLGSMASGIDVFTHRTVDFILSYSEFIEDDGRKCLRNVGTGPMF